MATLIAPEGEHYNLLIKKTREILREIGDRIEEIKDDKGIEVRNEFSIYQDPRLIYLSFLNDILRTVIQQERVTEAEVKKMYNQVKEKYGVDREREWRNALQRAYEYLTSEEKLYASMRPKED